uniref:leydig cell tumor 10 kDa protein homolog n=1 Tax=Myxine glutinosa TaxID=7769 RepID=UPI0035901641
MAQGSTWKVKQKAKDAKAKGLRKTKKGARAIVPKKAKVIASKQLSKRLEVAIRNKIETETAAKAGLVGRNTGKGKQGNQGNQGWTGGKKKKKNTKRK